jgi:hypothetical protein
MKRLGMTAINQIPPRNLDREHGEWPPVNVEDLATLDRFKMRHEIFASLDAHPRGFLRVAGGTPSNSQNH